MTTAIVSGAIAEQRDVCEQNMTRLRRKEKRLQEQLMETDPLVRWELWKTQTKIACLNDIIRILQAGYEEISLPSKAQGWERGYVHDPRPFKHPSIQSLLIAFALSAGFATLLMIFLAFAELEGVRPFLMFGLLCLCGILIVQMLVEGILLMANEMAIGRVAPHEIGINDVLFFKNPIPSTAAAAYQKAKESLLFDAVKICAPEEAFRMVSRLDPIIYGTKNEKTFLVAQFNLGEDLKTMVS